MLALEVRKVFPTWIAALASMVLLLALVVAAFWFEVRLERHQETRRFEDHTIPQERRKAA
jgi:flagellar biogenesis protein FliO